MSSILRLTGRQRRRLDRQLRATADTDLFRRLLALLEIDDGRPITHIADQLRVGRRTIYNWVAAFRHDSTPAALVDGRGQGRPRLCDDGELLPALEAAIRQAPDAWGYQAVDWTTPLLREHLAARHGVDLSDDTIRRELHRLGYVWKRSRYALRPDPEGEKKKTHPPPAAATAPTQRQAVRGRDRPAAVPAAPRRLGQARGGPAGGLARQQRPPRALRGT